MAQSNSMKVQKSEMEFVVLNSDIARLVLGYLNNQRLERAAHVFCKTSPHLQQEFTAYQQGLLAYSFFPALEEIICEHVKTTRTVQHIEARLGDELCIKLRNKKLSEKVTILLEEVLKKNCRDSQDGMTLQSDKENSTNKGRVTSKRKRDSVSSSTDDCVKTSLVGVKKRRRILQPFCFLSDKRPKAAAFVKKLVNSVPSDDEQSHSSEDCVDGEEEEYGDSDISIDGKPTQESTPRQVIKTHVTPTKISQTILENNEFQLKLVENINSVLTKTNNTPVKDIADPCFESKNEQGTVCTPGDILDRLVKSIMDVTEKDPSFDALIEDVIEASSIGFAAIPDMQCSLESSMPTAVQCDTLISTSVAPTLTASSEATHSLPLSTTESTTAADTAAACTAIEALQGNVTQVPPRTPLIIRSAITSNNANGNDAQNLSTYQANSSFGSLIDPNFSISKLIVLNSNESAQKQSTDLQIGNVTAENILSQLTEGATDDQIYIDPTAGHITLPYIHYLTNDGFLTNLPFLINNELVTQQLQSDNFINLDASRIEIPLLEPITITADQLPPNSVIVNSSQKATTVEEQQQNQQQIPKTLTKTEKDAVALAAPTSLDSHTLKDDVTPSTSGTQNIKNSKSLSTPRNRASHVRTLTFSPKSSSNDALLHAGVTPVSSKRELRSRSNLQAETILESDTKPSSLTCDKPIIKNVEILPSIPAKSMDLSANDSSNSCSMPPFFVADESNQTVIKNDLIAKQKVLNEPDSSNSTSDTPKGRQSRRAAVRSCKRQLSKASNENEPNHKEIENIVCDKPEPTKVIKKDSIEKDGNATESVKSQDDILMKEWIRLRHASNKDLDARLREINAKMIVPPAKKSIKKNPRRKKSPEKKRKEIAAAEAAVEEFEQSTISIEEEEGTNDRNISQNSVDQNPVAIKAKIKIKETKDNKPTAKDKQKEFNIKIPTPVKPTTEKIKEKLVTNKDDVEMVTLFPSDPNQQKCQNESRSASQEFSSADVNHRPTDINQSLLEKRSANIACLFDTPFKDTAISLIPPTPGISVLDTPLTKPSTSDEVASYLFGSLTKSDIDTPVLSAITPGIRFTPYSSQNVTPRTAPPTDYSSGSSYYKPDESDDLDRKMEKLLRDSTQKKPIEDEETRPRVEVSKLMLESQPTTGVAVEGDADTCIEIPLEMFPVEPCLLERIKGLEVESNIEPHYKLVPGLPEAIVDEDEASTDSSTTSSSNTSSTSTSSSSASSRKSIKMPISLGSVSDISSSEDEEWQKMAESDAECSKLVNDDGEVRYPVRSWKTPIKAPAQSIESRSMKPSVPLMQPNDQRRIELEKTRQRVKDKIKADTQQLEKDIKPAPIVRRIPSKKGKVTTKSESKASIDEKRAIDVLTALNLSAKKQPPIECSTLASDQKANDSKLIAPPNDIDDNAVSNIFSHTETVKSMPSKVPNASVKSSTKPAYRKCLQIEAHSLPMKSRKVSRNKNIVIKPLGFKGKAGSRATTIAQRSAKPITSKSVANVSETEDNKISEGSKMKSKVPSQSISSTTSRKSARLEQAKVVAKNLKSPKRKAGKSINQKRKTTAKIKQQPKLEEQIPKEELEKQEKCEKRESEQLKASLQENISPPASMKQGPRLSLSISTNDGDSSDEDEPFDLISIKEDDKSCFNFKYDDARVAEQPKEDNTTACAGTKLSDYKMIISFGETDVHKLTIGDETLLYAFNPMQQEKTTPTAIAVQKAPTAIRTIPKKRKIRLSTTSLHDDVVDAAPKSTSTSTAATTATKKIATRVPAATSTPNAQTKTDGGEGSASRAKNTDAKSINKNSKDTNTVRVSPSSSAGTTKIEIEDIESILSHLHGT